MDYLLVSGCGIAGSDAEFRRLESGVAVATVNVVVTKSYKKDEEWVNEKSWWRLIFWRGAAESAEKNIKKGNVISFAGEPKKSEYTKDGVKFTNTDIVVSDFVVSAHISKKKDNVPLPEESSNTEKKNTTKPKSTAAEPDVAVSDEDLPF